MNAQVDFFPIYEVPKTRIFTIQELDVLANNLGEAYEQTIKQSGLARKQIASLTGIHAETLSMMCSGARNCPASKQQAFYEACQNVFALQWQLWNWFGIDISRQLSTEEKAELWDRQHRTVG